jgi:hypothetical protein
MIAASSHVLFFYLSKVCPNGYVAVGYLWFLQEQIKDHHHHFVGSNAVCVFITAVPITKLFAWGGGGQGRTCK